MSLCDKRLIGGLSAICHPKKIEQGIHIEFAIQFLYMSLKVHSLRVYVYRIVFCKCVSGNGFFIHFL